MSALAGPDGVLEQGIEYRAGGTPAQRGLVSGGHLTQNLRLTHHQRIEAARHACQMDDRIRVKFYINRISKVFHRHSAVLAEKLDQGGISPVNVLGNRIYLQPVAGGEDDAFG